MRLVLAALSLGVALALLASACSSTEPTVRPSAGPAQDRDDLNGTWVLATGTHEGAAIPMPDGATMDLTFDGNTVGGTAACNSWFGEVAVGDRSMSFSGLGQTEMGCEPDRMTAEATYLAALGVVAAFDIAGDDLTLRGPGVELVYTRKPPVPDEELVGTAWVLDTLIEGDAASSTVGDPATLTFEAGGTLVGSTGCRAFTGRWIQDGGGQVVISEVTSDDVVCEQPLARQDQAVLEALFGRVTIEIDGDRLTITSPEGTGLGYGTT